jgi:SAM-dependent methyltransferase
LGLEVRTGGLSAAALAFDAIAEDFDERFDSWRSVESQRRAVRRALAAAFPFGSRLIEIGGGTGTDALWMADHGRQVLMTDAAPSMVGAASAKCRGRVRTAVAAAEELERLADELHTEPLFDGAYSVFAGLNCVGDLHQFGRGIAPLLRPGAPLMLVVFGTCCPGEMIVETLRGRPGNALRRFKRSEVPARLNGREFTVRYHRRKDMEGALEPWFRLDARQGIGVFVPPSAAEPWISRYPRLLGLLEALDRVCARPLAPFADHILYRFVRTGE